VEAIRAGIMFDMDNTLLQSKINFQEMRADLIQLLVDSQLGEVQEFENEITPAQVIERGKELELARPNISIEAKMWEIVVKHEVAGMIDVQLEEGVKEGISYLKSMGFPLVVITNNAYNAACVALQQTNLYSNFDLIIGRDQMEALKPSPSGIFKAINHYSNQVDHWVMLGDSWIDGRAALDAHVDFVSYKANEELLKINKVTPVYSVNNFSQFTQWIDNEWRATHGTHGV
jgi:phosphoglycolate phosphatase